MRASTKTTTGTSRRAIRALLGCTLAAALAPVLASPPDIVEWEVPWADTRPRDPTVAPDGRIWLVGQTGNYLAVFDPGSAEFERVELPEGTRPHTVVADAKGQLWVAGNGNGTVLRYTPDASSHTVFEVPDSPPLERRDPHTIALDGTRRVWFTMQRGNAIGMLDTASERMRVLPVPTDNALPYGIVVTPEGRPWSVLLGTHKLATVDPETLQVSEIELPREAARPRRIGLGSDGRVWYVDYAEGWLGVHDPADGSTREWRTPSERSGPYAMAVDGQDRVWFVETFVQPNRLVGFDPKSERFRWQAEVPSGGRTVRHMTFDAGRNALWFGADTNHLGRAQLP